MASSGLVQGTVTQKTNYFRSWIYWYRVGNYDILNNKSRIHVDVIVDSLYAASNWQGNGLNRSLTINGTTITTGLFATDTLNGWDYSPTTSPTGRYAELIYSNEIDVVHNADGTKTFSFSTSNEVGVAGYGPGNVIVSGSGILDTIPRGSLLNTFSDFQIETTEGTINGNLTIYSITFSHYVQLLENGVERAAWSIGAGPVGSYNYALTLTEAQRNAIFGDMPTSVSDVFTLVVSTFNGATQIGSGQSRTATGTIPAGYKPSITTTNSNFSWLNKNGALPTYLIQNVSTLTLLLNGGSASTGTSFTEYRVRFGTITRQAAYSGAAISENVGIIPSYGNLLAYYAIKDLRGRWSDEISETITVQAYNPPITNGFTIRRNVTTPTSADYILKFSNSLYLIGNTWAYVPYYWNGISWVACKASAAIAAASIDVIYTHTLPYSESLVYNIKVILTDLFNSAEYTDVLPTSAFPFVFGKRGIGVGKDTSDTYDLEVGAGGISSDGLVIASVGIAVVDTRTVNTPTDLGLSKGAVKFEFKQNSTDGLVDGGTFHQIVTLQQWGDVSGGTIHQMALTDNNNLWTRVAPIGGTWGVWKKYITSILDAYPVGSIYMSVSSVNPSTLFGGTWTTFSNGRTLVGWYSADTDFDTAEKYGGAKTHTLDTTQIPSHIHGLLPSSAIDGVYNSRYMRAGAASGSIDWGPGSLGAGGGLAHNNMPPYMVVYMWKRTA